MADLTGFHLSSVEIRTPELRRGRKNADFGQGFYLSTDPQFSARWADASPGAQNMLNVYTLRLDGLRVVRLTRDRAWFDYITQNRSGGADAFPDADVVIGPIANDTIYDTWGVLTAGLLSPAQALDLLAIGPQYTQIAVKTPAAAAQLQWLAAAPPAPEAVAAAHALQRQEETDYQAQILKALGPLAEILD